MVNEFNSIEYKNAKRVRNYESVLFCAPNIDSCKKTAMIENSRNSVVETKSHVTMIPAILNPTTLRMLSKYDKNFSKLNRGLFLALRNLLIA